MTKFEAVLHYGMTRSEPPSAGHIRDMFFAVVIDGDNEGSDYHQELATLLMRAYILAHYHEREDEEEELECLDWREAERVFQAAYASVYCPGEELPDGMGWFDFVLCKETEIYPKQLMIDTGHLLAHFELAQQKAVAKYFERIGAEVSGKVAGQFLQIESRIATIKDLRVEMEVPIIGG